MMRIAERFLRATTGLNDGATRSGLAWLIVMSGLLCITVLGWVAIHLADAQETFQATQLVFTAVLPLFGTWVGAVLAFYFARDNLREATNTTIRLRRGDDDTTPVTAVMIPQESIDLARLGPTEPLAGKRLKDLLERMRQSKRQRIPVVNHQNIVQVIVHESTLHAYAAKVGEALDSLSKTIGDLLNDRVLGPRIQAMAFVAEDDQIAKSRRAMQVVTECNDVFVTKHGQPSEAMIGWLTNTDLAGQE